VAGVCDEEQPDEKSQGYDQMLSQLLEQTKNGNQKDCIQMVTNGYKSCAVTDVLRRF
jgi:hypothetical protein